MKIKVKDFKVGDKCYIELTGNALRYNSNKEGIEEWVVTKVGKKYVYANYGYRDIAFSEHDLNFGGLVQKTDVCVNYVLYKTVEQIEKHKLKIRLYKDISSYFEQYGAGHSKFTLDQLVKIKEIIECGDN